MMQLREWFRRSVHSTVPVCVDRMVVLSGMGHSAQPDMIDLCAVVDLLSKFDEEANEAMVLLDSHRSSPNLLWR